MNVFATCVCPPEQGLKLECPDEDVAVLEGGQEVLFLKAVNRSSIV